MFGSRALDELKISGILDSKDELENKIGRSVEELVKVFSSQVHSQESANMSLNLFDRLVQGYPLIPLTGEDSEWSVAEDGSRVNARYPKVIKDSEGICRDYGGCPIYVTPQGHTFTRDADTPPVVSFPYMPSVPPVIKVDINGVEL